MYPLKFKKRLVTKVWGGRAFNDILNIPLPSENLYGESWEVSSHKKGISIIENGYLNGKNIIELLNEYKEELVGKEVYSKFKTELPILVKYLDINDKLSVQVHPDDQYAISNEGEMGKSESWYIIDASEDATIILGTKQGIDKESFLEKAEKKQFADIFNIIEIKKGDFIDIPPGAIHASLSGNFVVCEIQQNSDITYRIYDFDRLENNKLRELHLEKAIDVIDFDFKPNISSIENRTRIHLKGCIKEELHRDSHFNIDKLNIEGEFIDETNANFKTYSALSGEGELIHNFTSYKISKGDTFFIPALLDIKIKGKIEILKSYL